jgi:septal ring factor EnvC (AmiA/AmiB activator)
VTLFAENDWGQAFVYLVTTIGGGAVVWLAGQFWMWKSNARKNQLEDEARELAHLENLVKRLDMERVELREDIRKLQQQMGALEKQLHDAVVKAEQMIVWMQYYEALLENAKVPFRKYAAARADEGSNLHPPLAEGA